MSKEEQIKMHEAIIKHQREIVAVLKEEIEADEKPKLRHGDFGINKENSKRIVLFRNSENSDTRDDYCPFGIVLDSDIISFGNIFDLMNEWSNDPEDFESVDVKCRNRKVLIEKSHNYIAHTFIGIGNGIRGNGIRGNGAHLSLSELEELWHKLGQKIAYLKRKKLAK